MKNNFSTLPSVSISRSKFLRKSQYKTAAKIGDIVPVYCDEILPGDTRKIDFGALVRLSNPVAPIMDNIYMDFYAFFVPNRLAWEHWKEFMGENNSSAGIYSGTAYAIPQIDIAKSGISVGCLGDYLGLPVMNSGVNKSLKVSALPLRGVKLIYNRFFRDQNLIAPVAVSKGDTTTGESYNIDCFKAAKLSNYFTRALPYAQKGAPVTIPLGTFAPVITRGVDVPLFEVDEDTALRFMDTSGKDPTADGEAYTLILGNHPIVDGMTGNQRKAKTVWNGIPEDGYDADSLVAPANLWADLSQSTAATINQLRFAFQYQKMLEKDALYGTRYWEILKGQFGIVAPDASLQDPEYLGHHRININIDQVVQTTGIDQATPAQNELGQVAAVSVTGGKGSLFTKSFTEHGYLFVFGVMRHEETFGQGVERHWSRLARTDYYFPVFANLGAQEVKNKEIFAQGNGASGDDKIFGFQEAWAEYRYKPSKVTGILNPAVANSLGYWTLADNFAELPTLGQTFIEQGRENLARVLSTGLTGPDYILDLAFIDTAVRPMPVYSMPGLIDHH